MIVFKGFIKQGLYACGAVTTSTSDIENRPTISEKLLLHERNS